MVLAEDDEISSLELTKFLNDYFKIPEALKKPIVPSKECRFKDCQVTVFFCP